MNEAFADDPVPLSMTVEKFVNFQKQREFSAAFSFVARQGDDIAAVWFSTVPLSADARRAYTVSVGTLPALRTAINADFRNFVNVEAASAAVNAFTDKAGAEDLLYQQEMHLVF